MSGCMRGGCLSKEAEMSGGKKRQKHVGACVCVRESAESCGQCDESGELMSGWSAASV